jgi:integrase
MPKIALTAAAIAKLPAPDPSGRQVLYWDSALTGFAVLVSGTTTAKTYIVQRDVAGRTRRVTIAPTNVLSLADARRRAQEVLAELYRGVDPKARAKSNPTLGEVLAAYLEARASLRPASQRDYRVLIETYLGAWLDRPLREINRDMVEARHRAIRAEVQGRGRYDGSSAANSAMRVLRVLWNWQADRDPTLGPNPVRLRQSWFPVERRTRYVNAEQLPEFYQAVRALQNPIHRDLILLLLFAGLRLGEASSLTWESVDLRERVLRVPAVKTKAGRRLDLPMSDMVFGIFLERQRLGRERYVFPANTASQHVEDLHYPLMQVAATTRIRVSPHDLRRSFITAAESTDISPLALRALVNHSLGSGVTEGYIQMTPERLREPAQKVTDRLKTLCGISEPEGIQRIS